MNPLIQFKKVSPLFLTSFVLVCFALSPQARAVCQQGCDAANVNTFLGEDALINNITGVANTATGVSALFSNTTGSNNTANGVNALLNNTTGAGNIALGTGAGNNLTTGNNNIDIGNAGVAAEANTIRIGVQGTQTKTLIAGIRGINVAKGLVVEIDGSGRLGTRGSSRRFKDEVKRMDKASEAILALKPVAFR